MRFYAVDTLTGRILQQLRPPTSWELVDPLREPGTGTLTLARPQPGERAALREALGVPLTQTGAGSFDRNRWIAAQDDEGRWCWGGPIVKRPSSDATTITVPLVDWRSWFYSCPLRPLADGSRGDYAATDRDQALIADDWFRRALTDDTPDTPLVPPPIIIDAPDLTGVLRDRTGKRQLDTSVGSLLDTLVDADPGIEWWTYVTAAADGDPTRLEIHVTTGWPERSTSTTPTAVDWVEGEGGSTPEIAWPPAAQSYSRVWGVGDGEPPDQVYAWDEDPAATVLWESVVGPLDGVRDSETAYEHAFAERARSQGRESHAEVTLLASRVGLGEIGPGDRVRLRYDDGWESVDVPAARIVSRTLLGGAGKADRQQLTLDLADVEYPAASGTEPGIPGVEEG